jgi:hypothetical protein
VTGWPLRDEQRATYPQPEAAGEGASPEELAAADELTALTEELGLYDQQNLSNGP